MMDLTWMEKIGGESPAVPASIMTLANGKRVAVAASRCVLVSVRLEDGQDPGFPPLQDRKSEKSRKNISTLLRRWLTSEFVDAEIPVEQLREWCRADGGTYGWIGDERFDRGYVDVVLSHAPDVETLTVGFDDDGLRSLVLTFEGYRAIIAPCKADVAVRGDEPRLGLPKAVAS